MKEKLAEDKIEKLKETLPAEWTVKDKKELIAEYEFSDFKSAVKFVIEIAELAESIDHHPDIAIFYNKVRLNLSTHSVGGLTETDFLLAKQIHEKTS